MQNKCTPPASRSPNLPHKREKNELRKQQVQLKSFTGTVYVGGEEGARKGEIKVSSTLRKKKERNKKNICFLSSPSPKERRKN